MITVSKLSITSPSRCDSTVRRVGEDDIAWIHHLSLRRPWSFLTTCAPGSDELVLERERGGGGAGRDAELPGDVRPVAGDGVVADPELRRDLAVALAGGDEPEDLELPVGEALALGRRPAQQRVDAGAVGGGSELLEGGARRLELEPRRVVVTQPAAGLPHEDARPRDLVRRVERLPRLGRLAKRDERGAWIALREGDRSLRVRDHRLQHRALVALCDRLELTAGAAALLDVARCQHDLDARGQEGCALQRVG